MRTHGAVEGPDHKRRWVVPDLRKAAGRGAEAPDRRRHRCERPRLGGEATNHGQAAGGRGAFWILAIMQSGFRKNVMVEEGFTNMPL